MLAPHDLEDAAPQTLRSPPSTIRVRDFAVVVEVEACEELLDSEDDDIASLVPTQRYARVA